jgi:hypothetical protein
VTYGEAQETCCGVAFVSEETSAAQAPYGCETADDSQAAHRNEARYKCEKAVGG